jgi:hypothetical protein
MRGTHVIGMGVLVLLLGTRARAESLTLDGHKLLRNCEITVTAKRAWCSGYLYGMLDMQSLDVTVPLSAPLCIPQGVTTEQGRRVLVKYLRAHPDELHNRANVLTYHAFKEAFPCPAHSALQ